MRWARRAVVGAVVLTVSAGIGTAVADEPSGTSGLLPAPAGVTTELVLRGPRTIVAGSTRKGVLVVRNRSGAPIDLRELTPAGCTPKFAVELSSTAYPATFAFTMECGASPLVIEPGRNRFPFTLSSSQHRCRQTPQPGVPRCAADGGPPPLPAGKYRIVLGGSELALPAPEPLGVRVVR